MNDTQEQQTASGGTLFQSGNSSSHVPPAQQSVIPQASDSGVGMQKEAEPRPSVKTSEFIKPTEAPIELTPEVEKAGVREVPQAPKVSESAKAAGISHAPVATPVQQMPTGFVQLPMTQSQAQAQVKGNFLFKNPSESLLWLAMLIIRQFQMKQKEEKKKG